MSTAPLWWIVFALRHVDRRSALASATAARATRSNASMRRGSVTLIRSDQGERIMRRRVDRGEAMTAIPPRIDVRCDRADVPQDASNLAARAAAALLAEAGLGGRLGLEIRTMCSPRGGGGGGSGQAGTLRRAESAGWPPRA